jgi:hypothetical protein
MSKVNSVNTETQSSGVQAIIIWSVLIVLLILVVAWAGYRYAEVNGLLPDNMSEDSAPVNPILPEDSVVNDEQFQNITEPLDEDQEADRLSRIAAEREALLAEQRALEAQATATSTGTSTQAGSENTAERQREIDTQLMELDNAEEYPPLPSPGA